MIACRRSHATAVEIAGTRGAIGLPVEIICAEMRASSFAVSIDSVDTAEL
jgi:hypothetical protein